MQICRVRSPSSGAVLVPTHGFVSGYTPLSTTSLVCSDLRTAHVAADRLGFAHVAVNVVGPTMFKMLTKPSVIGGGRGRRGGRGGRGHLELGLELLRIRFAVQARMGKRNERMRKVWN